MLQWRQHKKNTGMPYRIRHEMCISQGTTWNALGSQGKTRILGGLRCKTWKLSVGELWECATNHMCHGQNMMYGIMGQMGYGLEPSIPQNPGAGQSPFRKMTIRILSFWHGNSHVVQRKVTGNPSDDAQLCLAVYGKAVLTQIWRQRRCFRRHFDPVDS